VPEVPFSLLDHLHQHAPQRRGSGAEAGVLADAVAGDHAVGALNLYSKTPAMFGPGEQAEGRRFADEASRALALAIRLSRQVELNDQLRAALASRTVIDHAIGIIMDQNRCDADAAFGVLRAASQNRNVKLHTVAAEIVTLVSSQPPRAGKAFDG
jgi:GAF domain-containing protein